MSKTMPSKGILRGLRKSDFLTPAGLVAAAAYEPDPKTGDSRKDGFQETSINWDTCPESLTKIWSNKNQTQYGVAQLEDLTHVVNFVSLTPGQDDLFSFEEDALPDNPYHGNLLFPKAKEMKPFVRAITGMLAMHSILLPSIHVTK